MFTWFEMYWTVHTSSVPMIDTISESGNTLIHTYIHVYITYVCMYVRVFVCVCVCVSIPYLVVDSEYA